MWCYKSFTKVLPSVNLLLVFDCPSGDEWHCQNRKNLIAKEGHNILITAELYMMAVLRHSKLYLTSKLNMTYKGV